MLGVEANLLHAGPITVIRYIHKYFAHNGNKRSGTNKENKLDVLIIYPTHKHIVSKTLHTFSLLMEVTCTLQHTNFYLILNYSI